MQIPEPVSGQPEHSEHKRVRWVISGMKALRNGGNCDFDAGKPNSG